MSDIRGWPYENPSGFRFKLTKRKVVAAALLVAGAALPPLLLRSTEILSSSHALVLGRAVCFALMALSLNILLGYAGQISLGHGAFLGVGAFASGLLTIQPQLPVMIGLAGAAVAGALFALVLGFPALRLRGLYLSIVTIAFAFMMEESWFRWEPLTGGSAGLELPRPRAGNFVFFEHADYLAMLLVIFVGFWLLDQNVTRTKIGRAFNAIRWDERVAQGFGVSVAGYKLLAFVVSGALAAVSGALYGHLIGFVNSESFAFKSQPNFSLLLVIIVVIGGLGSRVGVALAAVFYALIPEVLRALQGWELIIGAIALIDVMARHPGGFAGAVRKAREKRGEKNARGRLDVVEEAEMPKLPNMPRPAGLPDRPDVLPGSPLLEVEGVSVSFRGLKAVDEASLTVRSGQIVGLIGPNGAGKTTLFNAISGFVKPESGSVKFLSRELMDLPPHARARAGIGRTFQQIGLTKDLSVKENLLLAQHVVADYPVVKGLAWTPRAFDTEASLHERAHVAIAALGFDAFTDTPVRNLSHGQQRIIELGCVLVTAPELLLLDEPSAGMSPGAVENLGERLRDIRDDLGRTVLLIEHHIPLVLDVCDYIYVLNFGKVLAHGTTEEIARKPEVIGAYFGEEVA
ncbi:MAG TPA: branched-chain amino acid ABC transporter ATP-binding protein/permease [Actinomycetota bacterium]|nr:branched-chain amino acid ABC transporter ATP-binding protein/permease [Actinomycetota bacterium]